MDAHNFYRSPGWTGTPDAYVVWCGLSKRGSVLRGGRSKVYEAVRELLHDSHYNQWLSLRYPKSGEGNPLALKLDYSSSTDSGSDVSNHGGCDDSFFISTNLYPGKVQSTILEYITIHVKTMHIHTVTWQI